MQSYYQSACDTVCQRNSGTGTTEDDGQASSMHVCRQHACVQAACMCAGSMHACSACKHEAAECMSEHTTESICCAMEQFGSTHAKMKLYNYRILIIVIEMVFYCQYLTVHIFGFNFDYTITSFTFIYSKVFLQDFINRTF